MRMENVLRPGAISCAPTDTLWAVAQRMVKHQVWALAVLDDDQLTAMISTHDLVVAIADGIDPRDAIVQQHSTPVRDTASPSEDTRHVAHRMFENGMEHIPVIDEDAVVNVTSLRHLVAVEQWSGPRQPETPTEAHSTRAAPDATRPREAAHPGSHTLRPCHRATACRFPGGNPAHIGDAGWWLERAGQHRAGHQSPLARHRIALTLEPRATVATG